MSEPSPSDPPSYLTLQQRELISQALFERQVAAACPRCGFFSYGIADGLTNFSLTKPSGLGSVYIGGPSIPAVVTFCERCGHLDFHAFLPLGLSDHPAFRGDPA